ncbi:MAG: thioredoxin family protein [Pseudomonadota bacterium]
MTQDDFSIIMVGEDKVGIRGLNGAINEIAETPGDKTDEEVRRALLEKLGSKNYIAHSARDDYGKAFVREFRKATGQSYEDEGRKHLTVEVLGPGCSQCDKLERLVKQVLGELNIAAAVDHVTDLKEISKYGIVSTPALVINGKIVSKGTVPPVKRIKEWLAAAGPR